MVYPRGNVATYNAYQKLYNTREWKQIKARVHNRDMWLCQNCHCITSKGLARNNPRLAIADHIKAHKGNKELFTNLNNIQTLCKYCHDGHKQHLDKNTKRMQRVDGWLS